MYNIYKSSSPSIDFNLDGKGERIKNWCKSLFASSPPEMSAERIYRGKVNDFYKDVK